MTNTTTGWIIGVAAIGMMSAALGTEVSGLETWDAATTPAFVGQTLVHFGAVIAAFVGGKMIPTNGDSQ